MGLHGGTVQTWSYPVCRWSRLRVDASSSDEAIGVRPSPAFVIDQGDDETYLLGIVPLENLVFWLSWLTVVEGPVPTAPFTGLAICVV